MQLSCLLLVPAIRNKTLDHVQTRVQLRTRRHLLLVSCHHLIIEHLHELLLHIYRLVVNHLVLIQIDNQLSQYFLVPFKAYTLILTNSCFQLNGEIFFLELLHKHLAFRVFDLPILSELSDFIFECLFYLQHFFD